MGQKTDVKKIKNLSDTVIEFSRQRILVNLRFMESAMNGLVCQDYEGTLGTDGSYLYCNPVYILKSYQLEKTMPTRNYMHVLLHCIFRHFFVGNTIQRKYWDLACDIAVEHMINEWRIDCISSRNAEEQEQKVNWFKRRIHLVTAEKVYASLKNMKERELEELERLFRTDDHDSWYPQLSGRKEKTLEKRGQNITIPYESRGKIWKDAAEKIQVELEAFMRNRSAEAGNMLLNLKVVNREKQNYVTFLRKFAKPGEHMKINDEEFDYNFYTYGLKLYGNLPLIEPLEYKEIRTVKDFVVVIDTSGSVDLKLIQKFLDATYHILSNEELYRYRMNLHIIQCDAKIQKDIKITSQEELERYMDQIEICGQGGTDFRPVFEYVEGMRCKGEFQNLQGLLYFTDGMGVYPSQKPVFRTAFIFAGENTDDVPKVPAWAMKMRLEDMDDQSMI